MSLYGDQAKGRKLGDYSNVNSAKDPINGSEVSQVADQCAVRSASATRPKDSGEKICLRRD